MVKVKRLFSVTFHMTTIHIHGSLAWITKINDCDCEQIYCKCRISDELKGDDVLLDKIQDE